MTMCNYPKCERAAQTSSGGAAYGYCRDHVELLLGQAFAPKDRLPEWIERQREGRLPAKDYTRS